MSNLRVIALIASHNEADVIAQVIGDFIRQDVHVYLIDDASTDDTVGQAEAFLGRGLLHIERRLPDAGEHRFAWRSILERKAALAQELSADWFMHCDADELRESPWGGVSLAEGIARVDAAGFNAIDFKVFDFVPTADDFSVGADLRRAFRHYRDAASYNRLQINAWKKTTAPVDLASSGGHQASFPGRRVFPIRFLLRHYPIRTQAQGERKVFAERKPRYAAEERAQGWHVQYDDVEQGQSFIEDPGRMKLFDASAIRMELALEHRDLEVVQSDLAWFRQHWPEREAEVVKLSAEVVELSGTLDVARADVAAMQQAIALARRNADAQETRHRAEREVWLAERDGLIARVEELLASMSWRSTAPLRSALRLLRGR